MLQYYINDAEACSSGSTLNVGDARQGDHVRVLGRPDRGFQLVVALSLLAHTVLAAALVIGAATDKIGGGTVELDAISVTIVSTTDAQVAGSASASTGVVTSEQADDAPSPLASTKERAKPKAASPPPAELILPAPTIDTAVLELPPEIPSAPKAPEAPKPPDISEVKDTPIERDARDDWNDQAAQPNQSGGAPSAAVSVGGNTTSQAAASLGDISQYARKVALVVGSNRPKGVGIKGRVTVEFTLALADGGVEMITVVKSSGSTKLDALAVSVIGRSKYPTPPGGMTAAQLTYRVPFTFE